MPSARPAAEIEPVQMRVRHPLHADQIAVSLRATSPTRAVLDGIRTSADLTQAVAFVDACANAGWVKIDALHTLAAGLPGTRHIRLIRRAIELADAAARSPWESWLRVFYITVAAMPRPLVNKPIFDVDGRLLGIADLLDERAGLVTEFDGQEHRTRRRHRADNEREELFEDAGLTVVRADSLDVTDYADRLTHRIHSGYRRGLARDRRQDRWTLEEPDWWLDQRGGIELSNELKAELYGV